MTQKQCPGPASLPALFLSLNKRAFTLIELLVVVLIIGILAAIALPQYTKAVNRSRAAEIQTAMKAVSDAANIYYMEHGSYSAISLDKLDIDAPVTADGMAGFGKVFIKVVEGYLGAYCGLDVYILQSDGSYKFLIHVELVNGKIDTMSCEDGISEHCLKYFQKGYPCISGYC